MAYPFYEIGEESPGVWVIKEPITLVVRFRASTKEECEAALRLRLDTLWVNTGV
jgi:hypothetical protein